jgi:hypothetical protein
MAEMRALKLSGAGWASDGWVRYAERTRSREQVAVTRAAWARKRELGLIRPGGGRWGGDEWAAPWGGDLGGGGPGLAPPAWGQQQDQQQQPSEDSGGGPAEAVAAGNSL